MIRLTVALIVLAASMGAAPALCAEAGVLPVTITGFAGIPADSASSRQFMAAFRAALDEPEFACEQRTGDVWQSAAAQRNRFRLVDMAGPDEAWTLEVNLGAPSEIKVPRRRRPDPRTPEQRSRVSTLRTSRGLTIVLAALSPHAAASGARPIPTRFAVYFGAARRVVVPSVRLPSGGYDYPWADAGRVVAHAALEVLHRTLAQLNDGQRADLAPATRVEVTP
jgi:hypothetical protein